MSLPYRCAALLLGSFLSTLMLVDSLPAADPPRSAKAESPQAEFERLAKRRQEIVAELKKLQQEFFEADADKQAELQKTFEALLSELDEKVHKRFVELAPVVYAADPKNTDAAQTIMEIAFQENRFEESAKVADQLMASGETSLVVMNIAGVSQFALHNFQKAHDILSAAQKEGKLHPQLGGPYLKASKQYVDYWKTEQAVRAREAAAKGDAQLPRVRLKTSRGDVVLELFENEAPNTVANFISLVESGKYNGTAFHRVIPHFMVQGGDPNTLDDDPANDGQGGPGYTIADEVYQDNARMHFRGSLSMAHAGKDTGGSQFFITHVPTPHLNPDHEAMTGHTVFGRVVEGMNVVDSIEKDDKITVAEVVRKRNHPYKPKVTPSRG